MSILQKAASDWSLGALGRGEPRLLAPVISLVRLKPSSKSADLSRRSS